MRSVGAAAARSPHSSNEVGMSEQNSQRRSAAVRTAAIIGVIAAAIYVGFILSNLWGTG